MRLIHCALLVALTGMPVSVMAADAPSNAEISRRLKALDDRIDRLERREKAERQRGQKSAAAKKADGKAVAAKKYPTRADWKKVGVGMSEEEVRKILGEPLRTRSTAKHQIWSWHETSVPGGEVWFSDRQAERVIPPME
jgi:hypothetical protein